MPDIVGDRLLRIEHRLLLKPGHAGAGLDEPLAGIRLDQAGHDLHQRRLAAAVAPDEADAIAAAERKRCAVQQRFGLSNGGALKLTIARWLTPGGLDFGGTGVTPDVALDVIGLDPTELVEAVTGA